MSRNIRTPRARITEWLSGAPTFSTDASVVFDFWDGQDYNLMEGYIIANASGELKVRQGDLSGTWDITDTIPVVSGQSVRISIPLFAKYVHPIFEGVSGLTPTSGEFRLALWGKVASLDPFSGEVVLNSGQTVTMASGSWLIARNSGQAAVVGRVVHATSGKLTEIRVDHSGEVFIGQVLSGRVEVVGPVTQLNKLMSGRVDILQQLSGRIEVVGPVTQLLSGRVEVVGPVTQVNKLLSGRVEVVGAVPSIAQVDKVLSGRVEVVGPITQVNMLVSGRVDILKMLSGRVEVVNAPVVKVSGETVKIERGTTIRARVPLVVTAGSGGSFLLSGDTKSIVLKTASFNSSDIWIGGSGEPPYSGLGMPLEPGDSYPLDISNFNLVKAVAVISGDVLHYQGITE